jgi:hypothetical protein
MLNFNLSSFNTKLSALVIMLGLLAASAKSVSAWTWVLHHQGQALNTNNNFQRINNGGPRLSTWQLNHNDPDQRLGFVENGNGRHMIVHQSTGLCLNVMSPSLSRLVNTYTCNRNDPEQQFRVHLLRDYGNYNMDVMIKLAQQYNGVDLCLDNYDRVNAGNVQVHQCNPTQPTPTMYGEWTE